MLSLDFFKIMFVELLFSIGIFLLFSFPFCLFIMPGDQCLPVLLCSRQLFCFNGEMSLILYLLPYTSHIFIFMLLNTFF